MPQVVHAGVRIHFSLQGEGPPLVLHHGTASNFTTWIRHGYAEVLREHFRLVLIDARGHGRSEKPTSLDAHALPLRVGDVTAVLDALQIPRAHFLGYSMGGWIGFGMARHAPDRLLSLALGGAHPYADPEFSCLSSTDPNDPEAFLRGMEAVIGESFDATTAKFLLQNDRHAVLATLRQRIPIDDVLGNIQVPCWLFAGTADRRYPLITRAREALPGAHLWTVADHGHLSTFTNSDRVLPGLLLFLKAASRVA